MQVPLCVLSRDPILINTFIPTPPRYTPYFPWALDELQRVQEGTQTLIMNLVLDRNGELALKILSFIMFAEFLSSL